LRGEILFSFPASDPGVAIGRSPLCGEWKLPQDTTVATGSTYKPLLLGYLREPFRARKSSKTI